MNTPDNCYLDKSHDAHDLLGSGEVCKACGFVAPEEPNFIRPLAQDFRDLQAPFSAITPEPTQQDRDAAGEIIRNWDMRSPSLHDAVAEAIARARAAGAAAERESRDSLSFDELRAANMSRCEGPTFNHGVQDWSPTDWACAMAGECGEACNLVKKLRRGEGVPLDEIGRELADLVTYADLLAARLGIDLGEWVCMKFNEVSIRRGAPDRLPTKIARDAIRSLAPDKEVKP